MKRDTHLAWASSAVPEDFLLGYMKGFVPEGAQSTKGGSMFRSR